MGELNLSNITTTNLTGTETLYSVDPKATDGATGNGETYWDNPNANKYHGYYQKIAELKKSTDAFSTWVTNKGYVCENPADQKILDHLTGHGKDTFSSIMFNLVVCKKIYGEAYAEIVREDGQLINLKPLDPASMRVVFNKKGIITRYEQKSKAGTYNKTFNPDEIFHLVNDRVADGTHGTSVIEACQWVIDARNEAMADWRKVLHRNVVPLRIIEVDSDNASKLSTLKTQYQDAINKGEVLVVPKGNVSVTDSSPALQDPQSWISYLENFFYQAVGIPRVIASSENFTEASSKIGYLTFEPIYTREQTLLEEDIWSQLFIRIKFNKPPSLAGVVQDDEAKNTGQLGIQPKDTQATLTRE